MSVHGIPRQNITIGLWLAILCLGLVSQGFSQEKAGGWWNPFSGGVQTVSTPKDSTPRFKMPQLELPTWSKKAKPASKQPSMMSRMGATSKRWWDNTVDFVNPFNDAPPAKQGYQPQSTTKKSTAGSGMFGWMWREEVVESPTTVNDFLRQPKPRF
ncbi:MAG: hypothetical protein R3C53_09050 [Pirellulaceae bacterium]